MLVENSLVTVISLPAGVFNPYSGVKTSILILDKSLAKKTDKIAFFKVENDGFGLGAQRREVSGGQLSQVQVELAEYLQVVRNQVSTDELLFPLGLIVPKEKIAANGDYNLSGERYREGAIESTVYISYPLSELCNIFNGSTPSKKENRYWENATIPWFTVEDIRKGGRIIEKTEKFVAKDALDETSLKLLPQHSVLLCCTASVGEYAFTEIELTTNQQFNGLVVNDEFSNRLLPKFLFFVASRFIDELLRLSGKTSFDFVSVGTLKTIQVPVPPIAIQKEIVTEIEGYQKVINGTRAVIDNYRPYIAIDPNWAIVELDKLCVIKSGATPDRSNDSFWNGDIPWVTTTLIDYEVIDQANEFITLEGLRNSSTWIVPKGTVLMAMYGQGVTRGRVAILSIDAAVNQACAAFQIKD